MQTKPEKLDRYEYADQCINRAKKYIKDVKGGKIKVGKSEYNAVIRHLGDLDKTKSKDYPFYFDENAADKIFQFFSYLCHSKGALAGEQFILADWQCFIIWCCFGWLKVENGLRRFSVAYIQISRKNGKTTFAAGIALYLLIFDNESGSEVYAAATTRDQAKLCHQEAVRMVKQSPELRKVCEILGGKNPSSIIYEKNFSLFNPLSSDADSLDGLNPHGAIIDELHVHKTPEIWDVIDTATGARLQPFIFAITTAGSNQESVCYEQREHGVKILESAANDGDYKDDSYFAYIAEMDEGDDWTNPENWRKGNPNINISVFTEELQDKCNRAILSPSRQNQFRQKRLNQWVEQSERFINMELWRKLPTKTPDLIGRPCFGGLDLSSYKDLTAFVLVFPPLNDLEQWILKPFFWLPSEAVKIGVRERRLPYDKWIKAGDLLTTPGNVIDYDDVRDKINECGELYDVREIGYDPYNANWIIPKLESDGFELVKMRQGVQTLHSPTKYLETLVISGGLNPSDNAVMTWNASNVSVIRDNNGNIKPTRENDKLKIDGIVAAIMGIGRALAYDLDGDNLEEVAAFTLGG